MAQRLSEQVVEWLTVGGNAFTPQTSVPLVVSQPGKTVTVPTTAGTSLGAYINQAQLWVLGAAAASTNVKSSQIVVSSSDAGSGGSVALELWRGTAASWQLLDNGGIFYISNNYTNSAQTSYTNNLSMRYGAVADQYTHLHSTKDSSYAYSAGGAALSVAGGATFAKKVYINDTTDSNYSTVAGSFVTKGGAYIAKKTYIADTTDSNYATKAGSLVTEGGAYIAKKTYIASTTDSNYSTKAGSLVTEGGIYSAKKVYIADATDSNYSTLAGALVVAGGANFGKKVYLKDTTDSTSYTTGSLVTAGGAAITKQLRVQGVTTHGGNVLSDTNDTDDIGATATRWKNGYFTASLNVGAASTSQSSTNAKATYIVPGGINTNTNNTSSSGYFIYGHGKEYGHLYISQFGTANVPATTEGGTGTAGTAGHMELILGNSTAVNENTAYGSSVSGADNACGYLTMYSPSTKYMQIRTANISGQHILYLPRINTGTSTYYGKLISMPSRTSSGVDNFSAVGSGVIPIYVTADGVATAGDITFDTLNANRLMWTSAANKPYAGYHYANSTKVAINSSSEPTSNFYVVGDTILGAASSASNDTVTINGKLVVNPSYNTSNNSWNEGIKVNQASNGWAEVVLGGAAGSTGGSADGQWTVGRRGVVGAKTGAIGDFVIEEQAVDGKGLTIHKDQAGATLWGNFSLFRKEAGAGKASIGFYAPTYKTWRIYMGTAGTSGDCPSGGTPSTLGDVTTWALRSYVENSAGYGWVWESAAESNTGAPTAKMSLSSNNGTLQVAGLIKSTLNSNTVTIGSQNNSWCHIYNSANIPFIFNNSVTTTAGSLGTSSYYWNGAYIKSDITMKGADASHNSRLYLYKSDGTATGFFGFSMDGTHFGLYNAITSTYMIDYPSNGAPYICLKGNTSDSSALSSTNPLIEFANSDRTQYAQIVYTDFNNQGGSDSINFVSNQNDLRVKGPIFQASKCFVTANHGTGNPGSSTPGNGITGAVYFKRV